MAFIAAPVAIWAAGAATAVGVSAAAAATVGALAGAIAVGVVSGAVIGAAGALITGGNILDGALKGALIGGVSAGVFSGLGMATGLASSSSQLASMGVNPTATGMLPDVGVSASGAAAGSQAPSQAPLDVPPEASLTAPPDATITTPPEAQFIDPHDAQLAAPSKAPVAERSLANKLFFNKEGSLSDASGKIIAGGVEGAATALLTEAPEPVESQSEYLAKVQDMNVSGDFAVRTANINIPDHWKKYTQNSAPPMNPAINPQVAPGGAYAKPV